MAVVATASNNTGRPFLRDAGVAGVVAGNVARIRILLSCRHEPVTFPINPLFRPKQTAAP
jgi:hypothetical protein